MPGIKDDLKSLDFKNVYLLFGDEDYLRDNYKKALIDKVLDASFADFNYKEYTSKKPNCDEIADYVSSYPCMSEKKVLYIKDSDLFKKSTDSEKEFWQNLFDEMPDFVIIIFSEKNVDKRSVLYKKVAAKFSVDEFGFQKPHDLINWIGRHMANMKKEMSAACAQYLIDCCSPSMYLLKNEIDKLCSYTSNTKITEKDIDICCCKVAESRVFDMIDDALAGNKNSACKKYEELKMLREEPVLINGAIFSKFNQLLKTKKLSKTMSSKEIAFATGQKEFFVNKNLQSCKNKSVEELEKITYMCAETDRRIKGLYSNAWMALDILVATIVSL